MKHKKTLCTKNIEYTSKHQTLKCTKSKKKKGMRIEMKIHQKQKIETQVYPNIQT